MREVKVRRQPLGRSGERKRGPRPFFARYLSLFRLRVLPILLPILLGGALYGVWISPVSSAFSAWVQKSIEEIVPKMGFHLVSVFVDGRDQTPAEDILSVSGLKRGRSMLSIDLDQVRQSIETLPWVLSVSVHRSFPNAIYVRLVERRPMALWKVDKETFVIDREGKVLGKGGLADNFPGLPVVTGKNAGQHAEGLFSVLEKFPQIQERIRAITFVGSRRWTLLMEHGVRVLLPEIKLLEALETLERMDPALVLQSSSVKVIDLRVPDQFILQVSPEVGLRLRARGSGKET